MPDCSSPAWWLPYVQPFATVFLGIGAAALAYRQWLTANEKLRLDLFDRRSAAAKEIDSKNLNLQREGSDNFDGLEAAAVIMQAVPLFGGKKARDCLLQLAETYVALRRATLRSNSLKPDDPGLDAALDAVEKLEQAAKSAHNDLKDSLRPYLTFHARDYRVQL